jgi:hypothetical protein
MASTRWSTTHPGPPCAPANGPAAPSCLVGEVQTGLLQTSTALTPPAVARILGLVPGDPVRVFERPIHYALSPQLLTGLDCALAGPSGTAARVVGTAASRVCITGGHVVQGSSFALLAWCANGRRHRWSHYLAQPGVLEVSGRRAPTDLGLGFVQAPAAPGLLDLASISDRLLDLTQTAGLDRSPPVRIARTRLRWTVRAATGSQVHFAIESATQRSLRVAVPEPDLGAAVRFCEDVALHDWLITCLVRIIERSGIGSSSPRQVTHRLRPVFDHLLHLWMPAAGLADTLLPLWWSLDRHVGFSRQWDALVDRVRDQVGVGSLDDPSASQ